MRTLTKNILSLLFICFTLSLFIYLPKEQKASAEESLTFTEFPISENAYISSITPGADGNIWFIENITQYGTPTVISQKIGKITPSGVLAEYPVQNAGNITNGPDGNVWFIANGISSIGKITPSGEITTYSRPSGYDYLRFIINGPDGNIWFTINGGYIGRITPSGVYLDRFILPNEQYPSGITTGADGNVWFTEPSINKIARITPMGSLTEFSISGAVWGSLTTGSDGYVWFIERIENGSIDTYKIGKITPQGVITEYSSENYISGDNIVSGSDGNIWYGSGGGIARITPSGLITQFDTPALSNVSRMASGPDGNIWFGYTVQNDIPNSKIVRANINGSVPLPTPTLTKTPTPTLTKAPTPTTKPSPTPKKIPPKHVPPKKVTPTPTPIKTTTGSIGKLYWCTDSTDDFCMSSFGEFQKGIEAKMVCWQDDRWTSEGPYPTNRWFYVNLSDGREGFVSASTIVSQTRTPNCSTVKNISSTLWAIKQRNSMDWINECLPFVRRAYSEVGFSIGPPQGGGTSAITWWNRNEAKGVTGIDKIPPRGALVFWDGYKTKDKDFSDGHVVISIGNGYAISSYERRIYPVHEMSISDRNKTLTADRSKTFSDLYQGYILP